MRSMTNYEKVDALLLRLRRDYCTVFATFLNGLETLDADSNLWVFVRLWEQSVKEALLHLGAVPANHQWADEHTVQRKAWREAGRHSLPDPTWREEKVRGWVEDVVIPLYEALEAGQEATMAVVRQQASRARTGAGVVGGGRMGLVR